MGLKGGEGGGGERCGVCRGRATGNLGEEGPEVAHEGENS